MSVGGLGSKGLAAVVGARAFEVLGVCAPQPKAGTCTSAVCLCWTSTPIASATTTTVRGPFGADVHRFHSFDLDVRGHT